MTIVKKIAAYDKAKLVINRCITLEQFEVCKKYIELFSKKYNTVFLDIRLEQFMKRKELELNHEKRNR